MNGSATENSDDRHRKFWPLELVLGLLPFSLLMQVVVWAIYLPFGLHAIADFRSLYTGGYMVRTGHAYELFDFDAQMRFQKVFFSQAVKTSRSIANHPAYEELLFALLSFLPYVYAYWLFLAVNITAAVASVRLLWPRIRNLRKRWYWAPALLTFGFFPLNRALLQGQDSILLLLLLCIGLAMMDHRPGTAGLVIGLGAFRFQFILPLALVFVLWRQKRFALGILSSGAIAAAVSILITGLHGTRLYVDHLYSTSVGLSDASSMAKFATLPLTMFNLEGVISALLRNRLPHVWIEVFVLIASILVIYAAARMRPSFEVALVAACLVSYHFNPHDATIWLIPIFLALCGPYTTEGFFAAAMLFSPFVSLLPWKGDYGYIAAIPLLGLFIAMMLTPDRRLTQQKPQVPVVANT